MENFIRNKVQYEKFPYDVIWMEEDEEKENSFWYHCARLVKTLTTYYNENTTGWSISEICVFLHKLCMKNGGEYSKNLRFIGNHIGVDPLYIQYYMETDEFYKNHKYKENIAILIYSNFITIHPLSDGNGCVGKTLIFILRDNINYKGITTKKEHKKLCKELGYLQKNLDKMFTTNINVNILKQLLNE